MDELRAATVSTAISMWTQFQSPNPDRSVLEVDFAGLWQDRPGVDLKQLMAGILLGILDVTVALATPLLEHDPTADIPALLRAAIHEQVMLDDDE